MDRVVGRASVLRVGLISDTHGLLRPEATAFLAGSDHIVHAGDVGDPSILDALAAIAPLTAIRGNVDMDVWASQLPDTTRAVIGGVTLYVLHDLAALDIKPRAQGCGTPFCTGVIVADHRIGTDTPYFNVRWWYDALANLKYSFSLWIVGPRGVPREIVEALGKEVLAVTVVPEFRTRLAPLGFELLPLNASQLSAYMASEYAKWEKLAKAAGIQPQ